MISAARTSNSRGGFTLIEMVMVLAIAALVTAGAIGMMVYSSDRRQLERKSSEIEVFAKRARTIAQLQQKPYALQFIPGKVRLLPYAEAIGSESLMPSGRPVGGERATEPAGDQTAIAPPVYDEISLDGEFAVFVRRWASDAWLPMNERQPQVWRFDPDGLCEPLGVRLSLDQSWVEQTYHPLTASVAELSTQFQ
jgi:prepilin-type N-terminal cleavage/methylation domain-containing protein